jgi:hypothetical protein
MDEIEFLEEKQRRGSEIDLLRRIAEAVANDDGLPLSEAVTGFLALVGRNYLPGRELMVVGRATNGGWAGKWPLPELQKQQFIDCVLHKSVDPSPSGQLCRMRWVTDQWGLQKASRVWKENDWDNDPYSTARSAFWGAIRELVSRLGIADVEQDSWPSHLVWSNLYKIGPAGGGNPSSRLCSLQHEACAHLLTVEIETYRPKRIVFLTGRDWLEGFLPTISAYAERYRYDSGLVEAKGVFALPSQEIQVVVAKHPQGKKRADWVGSVLEAFGRSPS